MVDNPFMHAVRITKAKNKKMSSYLESLRKCDDFIERDRVERIERVRSSERTKSITYRSINPEMDVHPIYKRSGDLVEDYLRMSFTRFRTSSHRLKIETGRWSRIAREDRLCQCGKEVQTEEHVLMNCELSKPIREKYGVEINCFLTFMNCEKTKAQLHMVHEMLKLYEN